jgi:hypothetical protein
MISGHFVAVDYHCLTIAATGKKRRLGYRQRRDKLGTAACKFRERQLNWVADASDVRRFSLSPGRSIDVLLKDRAHLPWIAAVLLIAAIALAAFLWGGYGQPNWPRGGSTLGLTLGIAAASLMVFECLLWPKKRFRSVRLFGSGVLWMRAHLWLGALTVPLVILHSGLRLGGLWTTLLAINFAVVILSGIFGLVVQQWLPKKITEEVAEETIYAQIGPVMRSHAVETARLIDDVCGLPPKEMTTAVERIGRDALSEAEPVFRSEAIQRPGRIRGTVVHTRSQVERIPGAEPVRTFFGDVAVDYLLRGTASGSPLCSAAASEVQFRELRDQMPTAALPVVDQLERQCSRRRQLDYQSRLHFWLHSWLLVHAPLSVSLLIILVVHILAAWRY